MEREGYKREEAMDLTYKFILFSFLNMFLDRITKQMRNLRWQLSATTDENKMYENEKHTCFVFSLNMQICDVFVLVVNVIAYCPK